MTVRDEIVFDQCPSRCFGNRVARGNGVFVFSNSLIGRSAVPKKTRRKGLAGSDAQGGSERAVLPGAVTVGPAG